GRCDLSVLYRSVPAREDATPHRRQAARRGRKGTGIAAGAGAAGEDRCREAADDRCGIRPVLQGRRRHQSRAGEGGQHSEAIGVMPPSTDSRPGKELRQSPSVLVKSGKSQNEQMMSAYPRKCMAPPCVARENGEPGVRSCTNVSGLALELVLRTIMEIRAHPILLAAMPLRAISGVSSWMRREDQFSISSLSLADLGGGTIAGSHAVSGNHRDAPLASSIRVLPENHIRAYR